MKHLASVLAICLLVGINSHTTLADEPALPELKPLERFVGTWTTSIEGANLTGKAKTQWILGGRFVQQKYSLSDGSEGMNLRGYDAKTKKYVMFTFDSRGSTIKQEGTWDKASKTLTVKGDAGEVVVTTKAHFPNNNTEEWSITVEDKEGKVLQTFKGKNARAN